MDDAALAPMMTLRRGIEAACARGTRDMRLGKAFSGDALIGLITLPFGEMLTIGLSCWRLFVDGMSLGLNRAGRTRKLHANKTIRTK